MRGESKAGVVVILVAIAMFFTISAEHIEHVNAEVQSLQSRIDSLSGTLRQPQDVFRVTMTAYTKSRDETDSDPEHTAIMREGVPGWTAAVSRDLLEAGFVFGTRIWAEGVGVFEIADVMNARYRDRIDVMVGTKRQAQEFGVKENVLVVRIKGDG